MRLLRSYVDSQSRATFTQGPAATAEDAMILEDAPTVPPVSQLTAWIAQTAVKSTSQSTGCIFWALLIMSNKSAGLLRVLHLVHVVPVFWTRGGRGGGSLTSSD